MNIMIKRFLAFALSFFLIFTSTSTLAASPVGWSASPADVIMNGAQATITAIKGSGSGALQSVVKHAPTAANVGKKLIRGGGAAALLIAVPQILGDGVDWVLDPANNRIIYTEVADVNDAVTPASPQMFCKWYDECRAGVYKYGNATAAGRATCAGYQETFVKIREQPPYSAGQYLVVECKRPNGSLDLWNVVVKPNPTYDPSLANPEPEKKYLPISTVAAKVIANAAAGEPNSQELLKTVAIDDVNSGALDVPLNIAAVPKADAPAVPDPNAPPVDPDAPAPPFDPSSIIAAIKSVMAAVVNMSGVLGAKIDALMIDLGLQNAETNKVINDGMADVVAANDRTGARVGDVVTAIEGIEGNMLTGEVINAAIDKAIEAGHTDKADIVAAIEGIEGNTLTGEVINDAIDRVIAENKLNSDAEIASADAAASASDAIAADAAAAAAQAAEDAKAAADAKAASDAEFKEWAMEDAPPADDDTALDIPSTDVLPVDTDINFGGSCPANFEVNSTIFGNPIEITLFDTSKFCSFLSTFVKFPVYAASSLFALYILGGRKDV